MGARYIGDIRYLTGLVPPRVGLVLNVGTAHIGEFGGREQIAQAKGEIIENLPDAAAGGIAVLNADDPLVRAMAPRTKARVVFFGEAEKRRHPCRECPAHPARAARLHAPNPHRVQRRDHAAVR